MNLVMEKTFEQYEKLFSMEEQKREDEFRYTMMIPFEKMWTAIQVPLKAKEPNGYDVIMAAKMLGYLDVRDVEIGQKALRILKESHVSETAESALRQCIFFDEREQLRVNAKEIKFTFISLIQISFSCKKATAGLAGYRALFMYGLIRTVITCQGFLPLLLMSFIIMCGFRI